MTQTTMTPQQTLGILVNSDRHPDYVDQLARTAHAKGKTVKIHFSGKGVVLAEPKWLACLAEIAEISICRDSWMEWNRPWPLTVLPLTPPSRMADLIRDCTRCVVF